MVIPGRGRQAASPESITTMSLRPGLTSLFADMDSGLLASLGPGMTEGC